MRPGKLVLQVVVSEPVLREGAGLEVLGEDVAPRDEAAGERLPLRVPEVEGDGTLVAVRPREVGALGTVLAVRPRKVGRGEVAGVVACARALDLDDLGPEVAQDLGAARAGENAGEVEDHESVEGTVHPEISSSWGLERGMGERLFRNCTSRLESRRRPRDSRTAAGPDGPRSTGCPGASPPGTLQAACSGRSLLTRRLPPSSPTGVRPGAGSCAHEPRPSRRARCRTAGRR